MSAFTISFPSAGSGSLCVLEGDSQIEIPILSGPRIQGTIDLPQGSSLQCSSCTAGRPHDLHTESHYLLLTDGHVLVFTYSCELYDSLELNAQCIPKYIQRSSRSNVDRYFVICHDGPWYHQIDYDSNTGVYHLEFHFVSLPSGLSAAIVGGTNPETGTQEDYHVRVVGNILVFTELSNHVPSIHFLGQSDDCSVPTAIDPMVADSNGKRRVIVTCNNIDSDARRYEITADGNNPKSIEPDGMPIPSPEGDYLLVIQQQGIKLYRTTDYSFAPHTYSADILDAHFQQSRNKLFLSVAVADQPLKLVDVEVFVTSGGSDGVENVNGTLCPEEHCLPHGLTAPKSELFVVIIQEQSSYAGHFYNISDLSSPPLKVSTINPQPEVFLFAESPDSPISLAPTPTQKPDVTPPLPSTSVQEPDTTPPPSPTHPSATTSESSSEMPLAPSSTTSPTQNTDPNPEENESTHTFKDWMIVLTVFLGVVVLTAAVVVVIGLVIKYYHKLRNLCVGKPVEETGDNEKGHKLPVIATDVQESGYNSSISSIPLDDSVHQGSSASEDELN